ncbi:hypothetical protein B0H13DRAFT_1905771 [Mycena leptocephala]|nr:hypothetical protein B0H13DRAFT_1905771 [Mycena leptocephala]
MGSGDDHPDTLQAMGNLASTYNDIDKFKQAEELKVVVLEKRKQTVFMLWVDVKYRIPRWPEGPRIREVRRSKDRKKDKSGGTDQARTVVSTIRCRNGLWLQLVCDAVESKHSISVENKLPEHPENDAEELEVIVLEKQKQVFGDGHPDTLRAMGNLASTYSDLGKFHKAEELEVVVIEKRKQVLGDDHSDTLLAIGNLASTYHDLGKLQQAEELEVIVLETQRQAFGDEHPNTLHAMGNLAATYNRLGEFQQAEELEVVVLEKRKQKAEELQFIALEKRKKFLGDNHPDTLWTMRNLALTYHSLNKLSEAEELETYVRNYEEALKASVNE